jgi:ABC-2 type transport system permease protein
MFKRIGTLFIARTKEFYRDRSSLGWNILFPFLIIFGFSFIFNQENQSLYKVGIIEAAQNKSFMAAENKRLKDFRKTSYIDFVTFSTQQEALDKLAHHRIDFAVDAETGAYWLSDSSPKGYIVERLYHGSTVSENSTLKKKIHGEEIPYIEWLFPGILGMNIMFSSLFGMGYVIVRYRKNGVLKRISVTPVNTFEFVTSQILSRMVIIIMTTVIVYTGCALLYGFKCRGSLLTLLLVFILGGFSLVSLGLTVASRSSSEEFAGGVLNMITWPMMFLSEVWFSLEGANPVVIKISKFLPLTHMVDAARRVMNDGASLMDIRIPLVILTGMSLLFITISSLLFKWQRQ